MHTAATVRAPASRASLAISQVYGGGDNSGAPFRNDFVEVYNRGVTTVDFSVTPYSIQYASVGSSFGTNKTNLTSGSIAPGRYFLVQESGGLIGDFGRGLVPLVVPITLINHYAARFGVTYVADQIYLSPHPKELMLRNHV